MISSGGMAGGAGLAAGGGVGNLSDAGGVIGPASCARAEYAPAAKTIARTQVAADWIERVFIGSASNVLDAIHAHYVARVFENCWRYGPFPTVYRRVNPPDASGSAGTGTVKYTCAENALGTITVRPAVHSTARGLRPG